MSEVLSVPGPTAPVRVLIVTRVSVAGVCAETSRAMQEALCRRAVAGRWPGAVVEALHLNGSAGPDPAAAGGGPVAGGFDLVLAADDTRLGRRARTGEALPGLAGEAVEVGPGGPVAWYHR